MICSPQSIEAYLDEELDAAQRAALEEHLASCADCAQTYARLRRQRDAIRAAAPYYDAPAELRRSVQAALRHAAAGQAGPVPATRWRWLAIAACLLLLASISWNLMQLRLRVGASDLAENVLSDHIRSMLGDHLMDVASTDRHTVKPWFAGKLDFSPEVKDFAAQGFPLAGGRVEYLAHRRVAALVYYRRRHTIDLFIWPGGEAGDSALSRDGYQLRHWQANGMTYWAVSDVSAADLEAFQALFRSAP